MIKATDTIYLIRNIRNNKVYVGSTNCREIRWKSHINRLVANRHTPEFQYDWDHTKMEDWQFIVIDRDVPPKLRFIVEQYWIDHYKSNNPLTGYNRTQSSRFVSHRKIIQTNNALLRDVVSDIRDGKTYREISGKHGISLGVIHKIRVKFLSDKTKFRVPLHGLKSQADYAKVIEMLSSGMIKQYEIAHKFHTTEDNIHRIKKSAMPDRVRRRIWVVEKDVVQLLNEGKTTYREISKRTGISLGSITRIANHHGIKKK